MEKHTCKICNRRFASGKAMGGHIRSHLVKLPIPPKPQQPRNSSESPRPPSQPPSSSSSLEAKSQIHRSKKNRMQVYRSVNRSFSLSGSVHDRESDTESPRSNPTRRRSKRRRRKSTITIVESPPEEQVSSVVSGTTFSEDDAALCLLMLSTDNWTTKDKEVKVEAEESAEEDDKNDNNSFSVTRLNQDPKYRCETCKKVFRSYQALGGHKASHKKLKDHEIDVEGNVINQRNFECPFCFKVFDSGQALGGHKKVHLSHVANARKSAKHGDNMNVIDLNQLPAPEDDDYEEVSQVEFSAVSNAQVFHYK